MLQTIVNKILYGFGFGLGMGMSVRMCAILFGDKPNHKMLYYNYDNHHNIKR